MARFRCIQPLIAPSYNGKTAHELLGAIFQQQPIRSDYEIVRDHWRTQNLWPDFEKGWRRRCTMALSPEQQAEKKDVRVKTDDAELQRPCSRRNRLSTRWKSLSVPIPVSGMGASPTMAGCRNARSRSANLTWDNAVISQPGARAKAWTQRMMMSSNWNLNGRTVRGPVWIQARAGGEHDHPASWLSAASARAESATGSDSMRTHCGPRMLLVARRVRHFARPTNAIISSQPKPITRFKVRSDRFIAQGRLRRISIAESTFVKKSIESPRTTTRSTTPDEYPYDGYKWGMSIDLTRASVATPACSPARSENNIPVVGKDQVERNREMYWIRVDTYYQRLARQSRVQSHARAVHALRACAVRIGLPGGSHGA